jgi:hypothetical protein
VQIVDLTLMIRMGLVRAIGKYRAQPIHRMALPSATWFGCTLCRPAISWIVLSPRSASSATLALKSAVKCRRAVISVFLRYPVEYTLTSCPISWDHLNAVARQLRTPAENDNRKRLEN